MFLNSALYFKSFPILSCHGSILMTLPFAFKTISPQHDYRQHFFITLPCLLFHSSSLIHLRHLRPDINIAHYWNSPQSSLLLFILSLFMSRFSLMIKSNFSMFSQSQCHFTKTVECDRMLGRFLMPFTDSLRLFSSYFLRLASNWSFLCSMF